MIRQRYFVIAALTSVLANAWTAAAQGGCPSSNVADVLKDPRVQEALDDAWEDSHEGQPDEHEEGGWIYQCQSPNVLTGEVRYFTLIIRWPSGTLDSVGSTPPRHANESCRLVADFHTHPGGGMTESGRPENPGDDGATNWEASGDDRRLSADHGLPGIIRWGSGDNTHDFTYGYNGMEEPRDPSWSCPGGDAAFGWSFGDPHLKSLDGYTYDFQAIGTFSYLATNRNDFEIQVQQQAYKDLRYASVNSALAVRDGGDRIEWAIDRPDPLLNGVARPMTVGSEIKLHSRGILRRTADGYLFLSSGGDRLKVEVSDAMVDFYLRPAHHRRGKVRGLLGNFDGDRDNDFTTADGRAITISSGAMDYNHPLYAQFGNSWRVPVDRFLITRGLPAAPDARVFPEPKPVFADSTIAAARAKCGTSGVTDAQAREACAFDLAATGNDVFLRSATTASYEQAAMHRATGIPLELDREASGTINGREARTVYTVTLTPATYIFDATGSERTSWTLEAPSGARLFSEAQSRRMGAEPARIAITEAGDYRLTVQVRWEMLDGTFRFRVVPAR